MLLIFMVFNNHSGPTTVTSCHNFPQLNDEGVDVADVVGVRATVVFVAAATADVAVTLIAIIFSILPIAGFAADDEGKIFTFAGVVLMLLTLLGPGVTLMFS